MTAGNPPIADRSTHVPKFTASTSGDLYKLDVCLHAWNNQNVLALQELEKFLLDANSWQAVAAISQTINMLKL